MRRGVALACLVAVVFALPALVIRVAAEQRPDRVAIAVTDSSVAGAGTADSVVRRLRGAGITQVVVGMQPVRAYQRNGSLTPVATSTAPAPLASGGSAVVLRGRPGDPDGAFGRVVSALRAQFGARVTTAEASGAASRGGTVPFVRVDGVAEFADLAEVPVGYDIGRLRSLDTAGARIVLGLPARIASGHGWLERELDRARAVTDVRTALVLTSAPVPSLAGERAAFGSYLASHGFALAFPDFGELAGAPSYAAQLPGRIVRAHLVDVQAGDDPRLLVARGNRAVKERGVRLLVLRSSAAEPDPVRRTAAVTTLAAALSRDLPGAIRPGAPTALPAVEPGPAVSVASLLAALVILAATGGWIVRTPVLGAAGWLDRRLRWAVVGCGVGAAAGIGAAALVIDSLLLWQLVTLAAAVAGASLAVLVAVGGRHVVRSYALGGGVALATGLVVAALGSRTAFMTGLVPFLGVKALLIAPPVVVGLVGLASLEAPGRFGWRRWVGGAVRPLHLGVVAVVVVGVAYYLVRSGNSGLAISAELRLRDMLDELLYVRPRFKEALLGFPALVLAIAWSAGTLRERRAGWVVWWSVVAAIGTASMVDTFAHFHTPLALSLLRSAYSLVIGLVLGLAVAWLARHWLRRSPAKGEAR
ncbi:MAG: DUF5693 family protein [Actinopolymorphaceae bacterium]